MSTENIVIVESPAKAKTINKYLGDNYLVVASYGHIRDLPSKNGSVKPEDNFAMVWQVDDKAEKRLKDLQKSLKKATHLLLATDPDREGEAISWHILQELSLRNALKNITVQRISFHEITKSAVQKALKNPRDVDQSLVNSYLARRALDYLVGFTLSPVLWRKLPGARSAGRVQSVALRLIVDRERDVEKFTTQEYWSVLANLQPSEQLKHKFSSRAVMFEGQKLDKLDIANQQQAQTIADVIEKSTLSVLNIESKPVKRNPPPPFITSTLQQEASRKLGFSASKTMMLAQKLYEAGHLTYMRTDGVTIAQEALGQIRDDISKRFGKPYLPTTPRFYKSRMKNAQEAHEAIRPTNIHNDVTSLSLETDQARLYDLVWKRTMACQMEPAQMQRTTVTIGDTQGKVQLRTTGSVMVFDGFLILYQEGQDDQEDEENTKLPPLQIGDALTLEKVDTNQHFTEPPPRYSEASLVKKMEELGIGRPSTYASVLTLLQARQYVRLEKKRFFPEDKGRLVTVFLQNYFLRYIEYDFTADLENKLDHISNGDLEWRHLLTEFWHDFQLAVDQTKDLRISEVIDWLNERLAHRLFPQKENGEYDRSCKACVEGTLSLRLSKYGAFIGCSRYPDCGFTRPFSTDAQQESPATATLTQPRLLGQSDDGQDITVRSGRFGPYLQQGEGKKCKRASIPQKLYDPLQITFEQARELLSLPRTLGENADGKPVIANRGRFGAYLNCDEKNYKLQDLQQALTITLSEALEVIETAKTKEKSSSSKKRAPAKSRKKTS